MDLERGKAEKRRLGEVGAIGVVALDRHYGTEYGIMQMQM